MLLHTLPQKAIKMESSHKRQNHKIHEIHFPFFIIHSCYIPYIIIIESKKSNRIAREYKKRRVTTNVFHSIIIIHHDTYNIQLKSKNVHTNHLAFSHTIHSLSTHKYIYTSHDLPLTKIFHKKWS